MRAFTFGIIAACAFLAAPVRAAPDPTTADDAALLQIQAQQDRWQGRQHYLYDDESQPASETTGAQPFDSRACSHQPVRLRRSDGTTVVRRLNRCD